MGHVFFLCTLVVRGSLTLGWRGLCHSRGALPFFLMPLSMMSTGGSGIPKASPTGVTHPRLMAFFAIELTKGGNLRFPNLRVTQSIKRPRLGAPGGRVAKTVQCEGAVRCRGKVVANRYGYNGAVLCAAHKDGLCVPCQEGEEVEGGEEEEVVEDPNGVSIEPSAQCLLPVGTTTGHFLLSGWGNGREVIAPLTNEEAGGVAGHPDQCPLAKVCHGEALPWPSVQGHVGIRVPPGCILVVQEGIVWRSGKGGPGGGGGGPGGGVEASGGFRVCRRHGLRVAAEDELGAGRLPCGRHPQPVRMYGLMYGGGGAKYALKVKLWASWFCMDGGDEQAFLRSQDISANLNQEVRDVEEGVVLFQNQFLTCTVILTGDGKGMQAMGGGWV